MQSLTFALREIYPDRTLKGLIFDCDGVLLNSKRSNIHYYNLVLDYFKQPRLTPSEEEFVHMHTVQESLRHVLPPEDIARVREAVARVDYAKDVMPLSEPEPGIVEFLSELRDAGLRLAMHTNRSNYAMPNLAYFNLDGFFDPIITAESHTPKPSPEGVFAILKDWGMLPGESGFVGDSELDALAANGAQMPFFAYKNTKLCADIHVDSFHDLAVAVREYLA
jgi:phosphoglycolate phosphatase-like HAD superfamily hydrolase